MKESNYIVKETVVNGRIQSREYRYKDGSVERVSLMYRDDGKLHSIGLKRYEAGADDYDESGCIDATYDYYDNGNVAHIGIWDGEQKEGCDEEYDYDIWFSMSIPTRVYHIDALGGKVLTGLPRRIKAMFDMAGQFDMTGQKF